MCVTLGITLVRLVPKIYEKALEKFPKGVLIEVIEKISMLNRKVLLYSLKHIKSIYQPHDNISRLE